LHVDVRRESEAWPLVSFILMVDAFRPDNGATRFVPGSQRWLGIPNDGPLDFPAGSELPVLACGQAGSLLVFNGSTWHGHTANVSSEPRRSIQGAFIPRDGQAAVDWGMRLPPETLARMGSLARYVLAVSS
jgi:ectoine hydroxylase-related dioxygenase (phytanoyl-CoA dioxygenase family)